MILIWASTYSYDQNFVHQILTHTRSTHVYDASRCAMRQCVYVHSGRARGASVRNCALLVFNGSQNNNTWLVLSFFELFDALFLLSWLLRWTDLLAFFFVRVASHQLHSALVSALDSTKYIHCEGPAALFSPSSFAKKPCPPPTLSSTNVLMQCTFQ